MRTKPKERRRSTSSSLKRLALSGVDMGEMALRCLLMIICDEDAMLGDRSQSFRVRVHVILVVMLPCKRLVDAEARMSYSAQNE